MEEETFALDNILSGDEVAALFGEPPKEDKLDTQDTNPKEETNTEDNSDITEVKDSKQLFGEEPESVGDGKEAREDVKSTEGNNTSSDKPNFYSSITEALVDDGIFPDLSEDDIKKITSPEDFRNLFEERIKSEYDERQKRLELALNAGLDVEVIKQYENTISYLDKITPEMISEEGELGDDIRKRILLLDFMNKNFSQENAVKMIKVLMDSGEDIEQAKLALEENRKFFNSKYKELLDNARQQEEEEKNRQLKQAESLKKDILSNEKVFGSIELDKSTRQKVYDNIAKPIYKDTNTGEYLTALQKYKLENETDFIKNIGLLFTLTDGFKDLSKLINAPAKKEVKRKMQELEKTLNNTVRTGGTYKYVGSTSNEAADVSIFDKGFTIDL